MQNLVAEMKASLAGSDFLHDRNASSPQMRIVIEKARNLTSEIIPETERWMVVAQVRDSLPIQEVSKAKNIQMQIHPSRHATLMRAGYGGQLFKSPDPTHVLIAMGRSDTDAHCSVRFSLSNETSREDIDGTLAALATVLDELETTVRFIPCK